MNPQDFCYWLQGFFEISNTSELTPTQIEIIKDHLKLVFNKVSPQYSMVTTNTTPYNVIYRPTGISCIINSNNDKPPLGFK